MNTKEKSQKLLKEFDSLTQQAGALEELKVKLEAEATELEAKADVANDSCSNELLHAITRRTRANLIPSRISAIEAEQDALKNGEIEAILDAEQSRILSGLQKHSEKLTSEKVAELSRVMPGVPPHSLRHVAYSNVEGIRLCDAWMRQIHGMATLSPVEQLRRFHAIEAESGADCPDLPDVVEPPKAPVEVPAAPPTEPEPTAPKAEPMTQVTERSQLRRNQFEAEARAEKARLAREAAKVLV